MILASMATLAACQTEQPTTRSFEAQTARVMSTEHPTDVCMHTPQHDARWTPSEADISVLDPVLIELIEYRLKEDNLTYEDSTDMRPERYHRDYFGVEQEGWRFILVCGRYEETPIRAHDGGPSQFAAVFDTRRRTFTWFQFGFRG